MWRFALALLLSAAVLGQTTITVPNGMSTGKAKCSYSHNISFSEPVTSTSITVSNTTVFYGFVMLDGMTTNSTTITLTKNYTSISICSFTTNSAGSYSFSVTTTNSSINENTFNLDVRDMKTLTFVTTTTTVRKSGCAVIQTASLTSSVDNLIALIGLSGTSSVFIPTGNSLTYTGSTTSLSYQLCAYDNATLNQVINVPITLSGNSSTEVTTNTNQLSILIGDYPTPSITVSSTLTLDPTAQQYVNISVTSNIGGYFLYYIQELATSGTVTNKTLSEITTALTTGRTIIQSQSDYLTYLYNSPRNMIAGNLSVSQL